MRSIFRWGVLAMWCACAHPRPTTSGSWEGTTARITSEASQRRTYELTAPGRTRTVREQGPVVRTNNVMFDALYALALDEAREASVKSIHDGGFANGASTPCDCFETGKLWTYVWTRDTSYATDLALATLDPIRARNSLEFKLSEHRGAGPLAIVQDTGSGGSWPISTDRVVWALGARALLRTLDGDARAEFAQRALRALTTTLELDRAVAFDAKDGLYRGETSFLDWREQTYPAWTANDTIHIGTGKALSTNVLHHAALQLAAHLAHERGDGKQAEIWALQAQELRGAIRRTFWQQDRQAFAAFTPTFLDPAPSPRYDLLATSLAVVLGVADPDEARSAIASYPQLPIGPPVVWPAVRDVPVYHNRALWPFVTAYELRAARWVRNDRVATRAVESLVRGAALNLSNMENFEMEHGRAEGPVINSPRQLWSVAGYVAMVHDVLFGIEPTGHGLSIAPYITKALRNSLFRDTDSLVLDGYRYRGHRLTIVVHLPPRGGAQTGAYAEGALRLDGRPSTGVLLDNQLGATSRIDVELLDRDEPAAAMRTALPTFGPDMPSVTVAPEPNGVRVTLAGPPATRVIYRDGARVATTTAAEYIDKGIDPSKHAACWSAETVDPRTGDVSHRSPPACLFGARMQTIAPRDLHGGTLRSDGSRPHVTDWQGLDAEFRAGYSGEHLISLIAANGSGPINTGITCAVKHVTIEHVPDGKSAGDGYFIVPHGKSWDDWRESSFVRATLVAGERYRIRIEDGENMSALAHFARYTGGAGGTAPVNRADVAEINVTAR